MSDDGAANVGGDDDSDAFVFNDAPRPRRSSRHRRPGERVAEATLERRCREYAGRLGLKLRRDKTKHRTASRQGGWRLEGKLVIGEAYELTLEEVERSLDYLRMRRVMPEMAMRELLYQEKMRRDRERVREHAVELLRVAAKIKNQQKS